MSESHAAIQAMRDDFPFFARSCLKIKDKEGQLIPFELNLAQRYIHQQIEAQRAKKGYVRAMILKGRQQGASTYTEGRLYWRTTLWSYKSAYILSHKMDSTDAIFEMVARFQQNNPIAPLIGTSNAKELSFEKIKGKYTVATAGSKAGGRGQTNQFFHGSEVAFWENAADHFAASVQTVALLPGTEVILESTANGVTGEFYARWQKAVSGRGEYIAIFVPWFWQPEYRLPIDPSFALDPIPMEGELSELEYAQMYGCDLSQMAWRRAKIEEIGVVKFKQEYPATAEEAFQSANTNSLIAPIHVTRARKRKLLPSGPLVVGVDPAGAGGDRFAVAFRRGQVVEKVIWRDKIGAVEAVAWLQGIIDDHKPAAVFIDSGGLGGPLIQFLKAKGPKYDSVVTPVNFGAKSQFKMAKPQMAGPKNRRAEMWQRMQKWFEQEEGCQIPDADEKGDTALGDHIQGDVTAVYAVDEANNDLLLVSKERLKAAGVRSPDLGDAIALTFASTVYVDDAGPSTQQQPAKSYETVAALPADYNPFGMQVGGLGWMQ